MRYALGKKISSILSVDADVFRVRLQYVGGSVKQVSLDHIFREPRGLAAEILRGDFFSRCFVEAGALAWPNGFELCPDMLAMLADEQKRATAAPRSSKR